MLAASREVVESDRCIVEDSRVVAAASAAAGVEEVIDLLSLKFRQLSPIHADRLRVAACSLFCCFQGYPYCNRYFTRYAEAHLAVEPKSKSWLADSKILGSMQRTRYGAEQDAAW